jgi:hypothetical protein
MRSEAPKGAEEPPLETGRWPPKVNGGADRRILTTKIERKKFFADRIQEISKKFFIASRILIKQTTIETTSQESLGDAL